MNFKGKLVFITILAILFYSVSVFSQHAEGKFVAPFQLSVETIRNPRFIAIIDDKPEFGWIVPQNAIKQNAFQILVSSDKNRIDENIGDVWDSGKVSGNNSVNVDFYGEPLKENATYFWKVRIWDSNGNSSEYSESQQFKTGVFGEKLTSQNWFQIERIKSADFKKLADGTYFADFGKDAFATLELKCKTNKTDSVVVRLGEKLLDGRIDRNPGGTIRFSEIKFQIEPGKTKYQLQLVPDLRNTGPAAVALPDSFPVLTPFRYAEIECNTELKAEDLTQVAYFNYFDTTTSAFTSSDTILNQVWEMCKYSQKATSFAGVYIDGDRERIPYEADAYLNQLSHYSVDNEYAIARRTIEYFMEHPTWPTEWQLHVALLFYQDYMYTGNIELIKKYYEPLKHKTLMELEVEKGLISTKSPKLNGEFMAKLGFADTTQRVRDIVDWPPAQKDTGWKLPKDWPQGERDGFEFMPVNTVINSFYYLNMEIMAEFAHLLDKTGEEKDFRKRAENAKKAINKKMLVKSDGYYRDGIGTDHGSVHANMMPLAFGIVPNEYKQKVASYIKTRGMGCSVYGAQFLMEAVYNGGEADYALELLTATHDRSWYNMIKVGSTIAMEAWDMRYKPNSDWNHAWGAAPANIIPRYLWGIQPTAPGFAEVQIHPQMSDLQHCSITVPTIRGQITGEFRQLNDKTEEYSVVIPANMEGYFVFDADQADEVMLNGKNVNVKKEKLKLHPGSNNIEIKKL